MARTAEIDEGHDEATSTSTVRILIADADAKTRGQVRRLIEGCHHWEVCGEAFEGEQTIELVSRLRPHVLVLDLALPGINGLTVMRRIRQTPSRTEILILTLHEDDDLIGDLLSAGAAGYVLKSEMQETLRPALKALSRHRPFLTPRAMRLVLDAYLSHGPRGARRRPTGRPRSQLTAREREVLQLLAEGRSNAAISSFLSISTKTVGTHRAAIMRKLSLYSVAELVRYAIRNHVIGDA